MKKLLAIAVVAAMTVPAMAAPGIGGQIRLETSLSGADKTINNKGGKSFITMGGATPIGGNGVMGTYGAKLRFNPNATSPAGFDQPLTGNIGIKAGSHWVRFGANATPMDRIDDIVGFLPQDNTAGDGASTGSVDYNGAFGPVSLFANVRPHETSGRKSQIGLQYKAGPFTAGIASSPKATASVTAVPGSGFVFDPTTGGSTGGTPAVAAASAESKTTIALAYAAANYALGVVSDKNADGAKSHSVGGKYTMGKTTLSASFGKNFADVKTNGLGVSYAVGSKTRAYLSSTSVGSGSRSNSIGLEQKF